MVFVSVDFQVLLYDEDGAEVSLDSPGTGLYVPITDSAYRHNRWMGLFRRWLVRVRAHGREFWVDENWRRREELLAQMRGEKVRAAAYEVVRPANAKRRGCGCGSDRR